MTERKQKWDPAERRAWISAGAPILVLLLVVAMLFLALTVNFTQRQDRSFAEESAHVLGSVMDARAQALAKLTLDYAMWDEAYENVTLRFDPDWLDNNYYSAVADALIVFDVDGAVRHEWVADGVDDGSLLIGAALAAARGDFALPQPDAVDSANLAVHSVITQNGRLALLSVAAITPETAYDRRARTDAPPDYLAIIDVLTPEDIATLGATLNLEQLAFATAASRDRDRLALPLVTPSGRQIGALTWRHERPGSAAFALQFWPIMFCLVLIGVLAILITRTLVASHVRIASKAETALEVSRLRADFIATMSHELRTPLNAIIGYTELIQEQLGSAPDHQVLRTDTTRILAAAKHLRQLVTDVLDHARIDAGRLQLNLEPVTVEGMLEEVVEIAEPMAVAQNNVLSIVDPGHGLYAMADDMRLRQILLNLVGNAIKFTNGGDVEISAALRGAHVEFTVRDTGIGIAADDLERLFEPFSQANTDIQRKYGGTGLGLSISQKLAHAMGGSITAESTLGKGSAFTLALPLASVAQLAAA
ncbi:ATP-binding protein [Vitreimonas sp.]|uniref:ATP-binding protein n=1 Tax=Vitreimonas sp. TaxID=3069702 RepID=UPI002ED92DCE